MKHNFPKFEITEPDTFVPKEAESPEFWVNKNNWFKQWETTGESYYEQKEQEEQEKDDIPVTQPWFKLPTVEVDTKKVFTGYNKQDLDKFNKMYDELGEKDFREFLTKIAGLESKWQYNPRGNKTHSGLYQIKNSYLGHYTGIPDITVEQFVNNPKLQTKAALKLAKENYSQIIKDDALLKAAKQRGYDEWDLMAGAWLAGYSGMRRQFFTGKEVGDANGTTITKRMNAYKNMLI